MVFRSKLISLVLFAGVSAACIVDVDELTNGQCPAGQQAVGEQCVSESSTGSGGQATTTCTDSDTGYVCTCPQGYDDVHGDGTKCNKKPPSNPCSGTTTCDPVATCTPMGSAYTCKCPAGYIDKEGDGSKCLKQGDSCEAPL